MTQSHMSKTEMSIFRTDLNEGNPELRVRGTRTIKREIDYIECRLRAPMFGGDLSDFDIRDDAVLTRPPIYSAWRIARWTGRMMSDTRIKILRVRSSPPASVFTPRWGTDFSKWCTAVP
jgi:hypothetical protein